MIDPAIRQLLDTYFAAPATTGPPDVAALRAAALAAPQRLGGDAAPVDGAADAMIPGPAGLIPIRIYRPAGERPLPLVVYAHGGGWVTGSLDSHDKLCRILAAGVPTTLVRCEGMIHGFLRWTGAVPVARDWIDTIAATARL